MIESITGLAPVGWRVTTLGELCASQGGDIQTGPFGSQLHASDYVPVGTPFVMPVNIGSGGIVAEGIARIAEADANRLNRHRLRIGDIVYSRRGDVTRRAIVTAVEDGWICGSGCFRIRPGFGDADPSYVYYYLSHPSVKEWIARHAVGATMPNLNTSIMAALPIQVPPVLEQQAIVAMLKAFDDKIELNRRMSRTLEEMARALFKSWFVDFDPVRAAAEGRDPGLPAELAALFPDSFEETELGEVPRGWRVGTIGDVAANLRRAMLPGNMSAETPYIGLEHMPRGSIALSEWGHADGLASNKYEFRSGGILFGKLRPYFHKVGLAPLDGVSSTDILVIDAVRDELKAFVLGHVSSVELVNYADATSTGTKMPRTNWKDIAAYAICIPSFEVAAAYNQIVQPMLQRIKANIHEARTLAQLRDTLLPKLLSGEVRVAEAAALV